jgi:hypothetical protein
MVFKWVGDGVSDSEAGQMKHHINPFDGTTSVKGVDDAAVYKIKVLVAEMAGKVLQFPVHQIVQHTDPA